MSAVPANVVTPPRPVATPPNFQNMHPELAERRQWVLWRYALRHGKWTKPLHQPNASASYASSTDPQTWTGLSDVARAFAERPGEFDGVGFVATNSDPFVMIDLDHVLDPDGAIEPWAADLIDTATREGAYIERSPSRTGFHIIGRGAQFERGGKRNQAELYCTGRYFTMTGDTVSSPHGPVGTVEATIAKVRAHIDGGAEKLELPEAKSAQRSSPSFGLSDAEILTRARNAQNGQKFAALFDRGDWRSVGFQSNSEADLSLANALAFWFNKDAAAMERIMRQSALNRPKWSARRGETTYLGETIAKAIEGVSDTWSGPAYRPRLGSASAEANATCPAETVAAMPAATTGEPVALANVEPFDLWVEVPPVPALPRGVLPETIEQFAFAKPSTYSPSALAAAALATCSMAASDLVQVEINATWRERFCIWVGLVGASSAAKSPTISAALRPLRAVAAAEAEKYQEKLEEWERSARAAKKAGDEFTEPRPIATRYLTNDATVEALSEVLKHNEHGIGLEHDELSALIAAMDGTYRERSASQRGDWLALYDGGMHTTDRVGRGAVFVKNHSAALLGGITTDRMRTFVGNAIADGLLSRIGLTHVPTAEPSDDLNAIPLEVYRAYEVLVTRIAKNRPAARITAVLDDEGRAILGAARKRWQAEAIRQSDNLPRYAERLGKLTGVAARVAIGFAIIEAAESCPATSGWLEYELPTVVRPDQMRRAVAYVDHQVTHDLAFYAHCAGQHTMPTMPLAQKVGDWVLQHNRSDFRLGDLTRGIAQWRDVKAPEQAAVLELLEQLGWLVATVPDGGTVLRGQSIPRGVVWTVNARVHDKYRARAEWVRVAARESRERLHAAVRERQEKL